MDNTEAARKSWDQNKIDAFIKYSKAKFQGNEQKKKQHFNIFQSLLQNTTFKQKYPKTSKHSRVSLIFESLLSEDSSLEELLSLGNTLCKNLFYSDLLSKLIAILFEKRKLGNGEGNEKVEEFLKTVWFDKDIISELPATWQYYLTHYPTYLESEIITMLQSIPATRHMLESTSLDNIWNTNEHHHMIDMCHRHGPLFLSVVSILNQALHLSQCSPGVLSVIRHCIDSVRECCRTNNQDIVDLYPRPVQGMVALCTSGRSVSSSDIANVNISDEWRFILSTHYPQMSRVLLHK